MAESTHSTPEPAMSAGDVAIDVDTQEPGLVTMLLRDSALVLAGLSLWAAADAWYAVTGLWIAQVVAVGDALLVGLLLAFLFHEWGHYAGAKASGAQTTRLMPEGLSFLRSSFDYDANDHRQFHWMTYGAHIAHWSILLILLIAIPLDTLGRIALVGAVFGFIVFATVIEYNIVKDTWSGADPGTRVAALTERDLQQAMGIGGLAGVFAIAALA